MQIEDGVPLSTKTTLGLGGRAKRVARITSERELEEALELAERARERLLVLGGGSNLVVSDDGWDGLVLEVALRGLRVRREGEVALVSAAAGEPWDDFVAQMVDEGLVGIECLSGIPGLVGATPMQNVGAYGQEVSDAVVLVRAYDREARRFVELEPAACAFAYRSSIFRGSARWILVEIVFRFACGRESAPLRYAELSAALGSERAPLPRVREAVLALRRAKGMVVDPADPESRSAGSFFTNPVLDPDALAALVARVERAFGADMAEKMPRFSAANGTKVSAAWLIERAGFAKGYTLGQVGISRKHALALVNRGGASTAELLELARAVRAAVEARFGVLLEFEPVIV